MQAMNLQGLNLQRLGRLLHLPRSVLPVAESDRPYLCLGRRSEVAIPPLPALGTELIGIADALFPDELRGVDVADQFAHLVTPSHDRFAPWARHQHQQPFAAAIARTPG